MAQNSASKAAIAKLMTKDREENRVRTIATFHRGKKVIPLEEFVANLQVFERTFYDQSLTYKSAKDSALGFFKAAQGLGLGVYRLGRRKKPTRLIWRIDPSELLEHASELDVELKAIIQPKPEDPAEQLVDWGIPVQVPEPTPPTLASGSAVPPMTHSDIADDVRRVLQQANKGKGTRPQWMTAYQILDRLPQRDQVISQRGMPGQNAGVLHAAASVVRDAIRLDLRSDVEVSYFENGGVLFEVAGTPVRAGFPVCGLYRVSDEASAEV